MLASADTMRMCGIAEEDMAQARRRTQELVAAAVPDSENKRQRSAGNDSSSRPSSSAVNIQDQIHLACQQECTYRTGSD